LTGLGLRQTVFDPADFTIRGDGAVRLKSAAGADGGGEDFDIEILRKIWGKK
jgi:hypothetical protein